MLSWSPPYALPPALTGTTAGLDNAHLKSCNSTSFCCEGVSKILTPAECCSNAFVLTGPIGTVIAQLRSGVGAIPLATATPLTTSNSSDNDYTAELLTVIPSRAVVGLAIEAFVIVLAFIGLGILFWRRRQLNQRVKKAEEVVVAVQNAHEKQQQQYIMDIQMESERQIRGELQPSSAYRELPGTYLIDYDAAPEPMPRESITTLGSSGMHADYRPSLRLKSPARAMNAHANSI